MCHLSEVQPSLLYLAMDGSSPAAKRHRWAHRLTNATPAAALPSAALPSAAAPSAAPPPSAAPTVTKLHLSKVEEQRRRAVQDEECTKLVNLQFYELI